MKDMSPGQREKVQARMQERRHMRQRQMREKLKNMSPDERKAFREAHMTERMKSMSPKQKERFQAGMQRRIRMHDRIKDMSPEERRSFKETRIKEKMKGMTPTQKDTFRQRLKQWEGRRIQRRGSRNGGMHGQGRQQRRDTRQKR